MKQPETIEQYTARLVSQYGRAIIHVTDTMPFAYTVGLSGAAKPRPELLLLGVSDPDKARFVLNELPAKIEPEMPDGHIVMLHKTAYFGVKLRLLNYLPERFPLNMVKAHYGPEHRYRVAQVLIPDQGGYYPGELGCAEPFASIPRLWEANAPEAPDPDLVRL